MKFSNYIEDLRKRGRSYFTLDEVSSALGSKKKNIVSSLYHFKSRGELISPLKGLYVLVPPQDRPRGSIDVQDLVVICMEYLQIPYYAGLLTAANYHGASHQPPQIFQVISHKRIKRVLNKKVFPIHFIYKRDVSQTQVRSLTVRTGYLPIATPEETAKDIMTYHKQVGGLNRQATLLSELIEAIDLRKLLALAKRSKSTIWVQRMGYILSNIDPFDDKRRDQIVHALAAYLKTKRHYYTSLTPALPTKGKPRCKQWKVIANTTVESDV